MKSFNLILAIGIASATLGGAGCSTSQPGMRNTMGRVSATLGARPDKVAAAAERVMKRMDLIRVTETSTKVDGEVVGFTAQDKKVTISMKADGENRSAVGVRVGAMGDSNLSVLLLTGIEKDLGLKPY
jgi:hypothetical protein